MRKSNEMTPKHNKISETNSPGRTPFYPSELCASGKIFHNEYYSLVIFSASKIASCSKMDLCVSLLHYFL